MLLLLVIGVSASPTCAAASWAVVIGVSEYADPEIVPLRFAASDAQEIAQTFIEHCCVPEQNVSLLLNEGATKEAVLAALDRISELACPTDSVLVYVAGHGATTPDLDGDEADGDRVDEALLVYDSVASDPDTYILDDTLGIWMERTEIRSVAVFFDSCHSGGQSRSLDVQTASSVTLAVSGPIRSGASAVGDTMARDLITSRTATSRAVLAACGSSEMAYESRGLGHGVFTHFLIAALRDPATDIDGDGTVLMDELGSVVIASVSAWGRMRSESQTPVLEQVNTDAIVIVPRAPQSQMAFVSPQSAAGMAPLDGFVGLAEPAPIALTTASSGSARRFRFPFRLEAGVETPIVPGPIAPMEDRWITADPTSGYVYSVSTDGASATVIGRLPEPTIDFAIQSGVLYACFSPEENGLTTYDLRADFAASDVRFGEELPLDRPELTGVSISGSTLSLVGWSEGVQTLVVYDLHGDHLIFTAPIAGKGCIGLQTDEGKLFSLDAWHGFLVQLNWSEERQIVDLTFVADLNGRVPDGWLPYDPRGELESLAGFCFSNTHLLLSTAISEGIEQAELFEIGLDAPLFGSGMSSMEAPEAMDSTAPW